MKVQEKPNLGDQEDANKKYKQIFHPICKNNTTKFLYIIIFIFSGKGSFGQGFCPYFPQSRSRKRAPNPPQCPYRRIGLYGADPRSK